MLRIFYKFTFQGYMFNRDSMASVGIIALDKVVSCNVTGSFITVFCEVPNYIDEQILEKAVKGFKVSRWECLGGVNVLPQAETNVLHYVNKHNLHFVCGVSDTNLLIQLKGQSKYLLENKLISQRLKVNQKFTPDMFRSALYNDSFAEMDSICSALQKYF